MVAAETSRTMSSIFNNKSYFLLQAGLIEANGELKVFIDQNLSPGKGKNTIFSKTLHFLIFSYAYYWL